MQKCEVKSEKSLRDEGKTLQEIAEIVDCSVSTVHKYLAKLN